MAVVYSKSQAERINGLFASLTEKLDGVSGELRQSLEKDLEELRGSVTGLLYSRSEEENAARMKYLQAVLSESESRYRELGENLLDPLAIFDTDLRLIYRNPAAERASLVPNEIAIGKTFDELYPNLVGSELYQTYLAALQTGETQTYINHWICPDTGKDCYYEINFYPSRDWLVVISENVTERMDALEALRMSEKFNRQLIESSYDSIKVLDLEGRLLSINSGGLHLLEAENTSAVIGRNWITFWQEEDRPRVQAAVDAACGGQVGTFQASRKSFQGKELWWDVVISPIRRADDQVERLLVVSRNITQRKHAEDALQKSEAHARQQLAEIEAIYANAPIGLCVFDEQLRWKRLNQRIAEMNGVPLEDHIGKTPSEIVPDVGQQAEDALKQILETGQPLLDFEMVGTTAAKPGVVRFWNERWTPVKDEHGNITGISVVAEEITERKRAEEELRRTGEILQESEGRFRAMADGTPVIIWVHDSNGELEFINQAWTDYFGPTIEQIKANGWIPIVHPDDVSGYVDLFNKCTEERKPFRARARVRVKDGSERWIDSYGQPRFSDTGEFLGMAGSSIDITEQILAEAALRKSEEKFAKAFHSSPVPMALTRLADGRYIDVNDNTCRLLGYTREEMLNKTTLDLNIYENEAKRNEFLNMLHIEGRIRNSQQTIYNRQGKPITALLSFEKIEVDGEDCILATMMDITMQKRIEAEREALVEELRVQKDLLERLIEFSPIAIAMLKGPEHRFVLVNPAQVALFPTINQYTGRTVTEVWPESKEIILPVLDKVYQTGEPFNATDAPWITDKGHGPEEAFYSFSYTPLYTVKGSIEGILVLSKETTEQVRIRQRLEVELEERKLAEAALAKVHDDLVNERNRLMAVMEALPVGLAIYDEKGGVMQANPGFEAVWGSPRPPAYSLDDYEMYKAWWVQTGKRVQPEEWASAKSIFTGEPVIGQYLRILRFDGKYGYVMNSGAPVRNAAGDIIGGAVAIMDITERVAIERALQDSQNRFRVAMSSVPLTVYTCDRDLRTTWVYNPPKGSLTEDVLGKRDDEVLPPEEVGDLMAAKQQAIDTGQGGMHDIKMNIGGEERFYILTTDPIRNALGEVTGLTCASIDITEQKRLEIERQEVQMKIEVQRRLMDQREKERQGIARDIHDGPIQTLASTAFNIQVVKESFPDPTLAVELNQIALNVKSAVRELRTVVTDLRPPSIIRFGLNRALMMHAEDLRERYPEIELELYLDEDGARLSEQACLTVFRVFQEGMNNIFRHAGASRVQVKYTVTETQFVLELRDNGQGFAVPKDFTNLTIDGHYGLAGMKERVEAVGGTFTIASQPGKGTTITVKGPLAGG